MKEQKRLFSLLSSLEHKSWEKRLDSLEVLAKQDHLIARFAARSMIHDKSAMVRQHAVELLAKQGRKSDFRILTHALQDKKWTVRSSAAEALGSYKHKKTRKLLLSAVIGDRNAVVRRDSALSLAFQGSDKALPVLQAAFDTECDPLASVGIAYALYKLAGSEYQEQFLSFLDTPDDTIRHNMINIISHFGINSYDNQPILNSLQRMILLETNPGVKKDAITLQRKLIKNSKSA